MINNYSNKNSNWQEADQLAIYKLSVAKKLNLGILCTTSASGQNRIWTRDLQISNRHSNHSAMLPPIAGGWEESSAGPNNSKKSMRSRSALGSWKKSLPWVWIFSGTTQYLDIQITNLSFLCRYNSVEWVLFILQGL